MVSRIFDNDRVRIYCWLFCVLTVLCVVCLLSWLSLTPKNPCFKISETIFPFDSNTNHSIHRISLRIFNPNKRMGILYSGFTLNLYEAGCCIIGTNSSTPAFYQGYKNTTSLDILIRINQEVSKLHTKRGNVDFVVGVQTYVRFRILRWKTKWCLINYKSAVFPAAEYDLSGEVLGPAPASVEIKASSNLKFN